MKFKPALTSTLLTISLCGTAMAQDTLTALPFGAIKPTGWLEKQMKNDLDNGFVGSLDKLVPDLIYDDDIYGKDRLTKLVKRKDVGTHNAGHEWEVQFLWWNSETQSNWWDGYLRNVLLVDHPTLNDKVSKYVDAKLATADDDGYIGIYGEDLRYDHATENGELWAQASLFRGLLAYYEATGKKDVLDAVIKAVDLTIKSYPAYKSTPFKTKDAFAGVGHGLTFVDVLNTLYRITDDKKYLDYAVFLFDDYSEHPQPEEDIQLDNLMDDEYKFKGHGVHTYEHLRALTIAAYHSDDEKYTKALEKFLARLEKVTTASGGAIGDEWIGGRHAHHSDTGYEYCSLQELLHSYAVLLQKTGDSAWADKIEWLIYNAGQGARHPDGKTMAYCHTDNSVDVLGHIDMNNPQGEMRFKYSAAHQDVAVCCAPNAGRIYPYFTQNMWQLSEDGIVANLFGPSVVSANIKGVKVTIEQVTQYPFEHDIKFVVKADKPVDFNLALRLPEWADKFELDGANGKNKDGYVEITKNWKGSQSFTFALKDKPVVKRHGENVAGVHFGPMLYALEIGYTQTAAGRDYGHGFADQLFKGLNKNDEKYQINENTSFTPLYEGLHDSWTHAPKLTGKLYDPSSNKDVDVELVPMGDTVLRKVSFDITTKGGAK